MTRQQLIDQIIGEITASCAIPFFPSNPELERIINLEQEYLYREYRSAVCDNYYILDKRYFQTQEWRDTRTFQLPPCVMGVKELYEITGGSRIFGINDPDLKFDRLMAADLYLTPLSSNQMAYRTVQWSFWDMSKSFNLKEINHNFNINTKRLIITGRDPSESLYLKCISKIEPEALYDDVLVQKWMIAKSKLSLTRVLSFFNYSLVGNVTINWADIKMEAKEELEELKQIINNVNSPDWFIMTT